MMRLNALMPRKVVEAIARAMKSDQVLADPDHGRRAAYEARMMQTIAHAEPPTAQVEAPAREVEAAEPAKEPV